MAAPLNPTPFFLARADVRLFALRYAAACGVPRGRVLIAPPFADELNKCRRLLAQTARHLSAAGYEVLLMDLSGTGDSTGEFGAASWERWVADLAAAQTLLCAEGDLPLCLLGVRTGALFALDLAQGAHGFNHLVLWQPVLNGEAFLKQFLRVRVMASKFAGQDESVAELLAALEQGSSVEVGGYAVSALLAQQLRALNLNALALPAATRVDVLEFKPDAAASLSPVLATWTAALTGTGVDARCTLVNADPFWSSQEVVAPTAVSLATAQVLNERLAL